MPFYPQLRIFPSTSIHLKKKRIRTAEKLKLLRSKLNQHFVESGSRPNNRHSVKIATWNLREFGDSNYKGRDFEPLYYIGEIISHFDLVALQEIRGDLKEFEDLLKILGPDWCYVATDVTDGSAGNGERMVFLYNERKVDFKNIAGELTLKEDGKIRAAFGERIRLQNGLKLKLPDGQDLSGTYKASLRTDGDKKKLSADLEIPLPKGTILEVPEGSSIVVTKNNVVESPSRGRAKIDLPTEIHGKEYRLRFKDDSFDDSFKQFARSPFIISFQAGWLKLNLCTVHIYYGSASDNSKLEQRRKEIELLAKSLALKAEGEFSHDKESFLGVLGDFNIIGKDHPTMEGLESNDFVIPEQLKTIPGSNVARDKAYDQIAFWKPNKITNYAKLDIISANIFDFFKVIYKNEDEAVYRSESAENGLKTSTKFETWRTYKMSDHLPMWIELRTDFGDEYLDDIIAS